MLRLADFGVEEVAVDEGELAVSEGEMESNAGGPG
jgi:hypothetical protein